MMSLNVFGDCWSWLASATPCRLVMLMVLYPRFGVHRVGFDGQGPLWQLPARGIVCENCGAWMSFKGGRGGTAGVTVPHPQLIFLAISCVLPAPVVRLSSRSPRFRPCFSLNGE